jgi:hypothetical protein
MDGFSDRRSHPSSSFREATLGEAAVLKRGAMCSGHLATHDGKRDATRGCETPVVTHIHQRGLVLPPPDGGERCALPCSRSRRQRASRPAAVLACVLSRQKLFSNHSRRRRHQQTLPELREAGCARLRPLSSGARSCPQISLHMSLGQDVGHHWRRPQA